MTDGAAAPDGFTNEPLAIDALPRLSEEAFVSVDGRYLWVRLAPLIVAAVVVVIAAVVTRRAGASGVATIVAAVLLVVIAIELVRSVIEVRRLAYQLREHDVSLRSGALRHQVETIPFARIQHVSTHRGPVERLLGLATLEVSSAGPDISIPGLDADDADRIKHLVTDRAGVAVGDDGATHVTGDRGTTSGPTVT